MHKGYPRESRYHNYGHGGSRCCGCGCCEPGCMGSHPYYHPHFHDSCCQEAPPEPCTCKPKFVRRFKSPEEELEKLEEYKKELSRELAGVDQKIKELKTTN